MPAARTDPLKSFRFLVEVESEGKKIVAAFSQFSGVKMSLESVDVRVGSDHRGVMDSVPAMTRFENITLTKGVIGDNEFLDWILAAMPDSTAAPTGKQLARTLNIVAINDDNKRAVTWALSDAVPVAYELSPMDSSQSAVLSESITFGIMGFTRMTHTPPLAL